MKKLNTLAASLLVLCFATDATAATEVSLSQDKPFELEISKLKKDETFVVETQDLLVSISVMAEGVIIISPLVGELSLNGATKSGSTISTKFGAKTSLSIWPVSKLKLSLTKDGPRLVLDFPDWIMTIRVDRAPEGGLMAKANGLNVRLLHGHRLDTDRKDGTIHFRLCGREFPGLLLGDAAEEKQKEKTEIKEPEKNKIIKELVLRADGANWQISILPELPPTILKPADVSP